MNDEVFKSILEFMEMANDHAQNWRQKMAMTKGMYSSDKDNWQTPPELFKKLDDDFHFTLDPASDGNNALCEKHYTAKEDGLNQSWQGEVVFLNPPYGRDMIKWVQKARAEWLKGDCTIVLLLASRTDTKWFQDYIYSVDGAKWNFTRGRVKFIDPDTGKPAGSPAFGSVIVEFHKSKVYKNVFIEV